MFTFVVTFRHEGFTLHTDTTEVRYIIYIYAVECRMLKCVLK